MKASLIDTLPLKPEVRLRIYAWTPKDPPEAYVGLIKIGQTTWEDVNERIHQSQGQMAQEYTLHTNRNSFGEREDGTIFRDIEVRQRLIDKGFENVIVEGSREWIRCTPADVKTVIAELQKGLKFRGAHHEDFGMRREQADAVKQTLDYFRSRWADDSNSVPHFLWNAKMRFGKTFTSYQLAKKLGAKRVLVLTYVPAVEDAWRADLESHQDFDGWQFLSRRTTDSVSDVFAETPLVYFASFQDLLGKEDGNIKTRNEHIHGTRWDLVIFDEYHFGAWRDSALDLFRKQPPATVEGLEEKSPASEAKSRGASYVLRDVPDPYAPITTRSYLHLSGTPFKSLAKGEFIEEQIFSWTYTDEQRAKAEFSEQHPTEKNPYAALPQLCLMTYQMPDELLSIANAGEYDEFDLSEFFAAVGDTGNASFKHKNEVQKWLSIIRGAYAPQTVESLKTGLRAPFPYSDVRLLPYLQHSFWYLPSVAACHAMAKLLKEPQNAWWGDYTSIVVAGNEAGIGIDALPPVRKAIGSGHATKTITLSCAKLTTGMTVPQWSSILMLRNMKSPETYFQAAFRVQSPWSIKNPDGNDPQREQVLKPVCFVFDFAPTRALRQLCEYGVGLAPGEANPEKAIADLVSFLPVLAYDGANMTQVDVRGILDIAMAGTSATLLARRWESPMLVNVDNATLRRVLSNKKALAAIERIKGWRTLGDKVIETIVNQSEELGRLKKTQHNGGVPIAKKKISKEEKECQELRKKVQSKLIKFAVRIPIFMYLTDFRENKLVDVITRIEPDLFLTATGLTIEDFHLLVDLDVFNTERMNGAVFAFRRYEDASLRYTGIDSHEGLTQIGGFDIIVAVD
jgi:hypothetical protein